MNAKSDQELAAYFRALEAFEALGKKPTDDFRGVLCEMNFGFVNIRREWIN